LRRPPRFLSTGALAMPPHKPSSPVRRTFLKRSAAAGIAATATPWLLSESGLERLGRVSAAEAVLPPGSVRFDEAIEPVVRLLEDTPRSRVIEETASRIANNQLSYRELLSGLLLAGIRNIQPRPSVGFKFHAVLVVNSAHLASLASPDSDRWLPMLWAVDAFKASQARDTQEGNWTMSAVDEQAVPHADQAAARFRQAMTDWDEAAADVAAAAIARDMPPAAAFDIFTEFAARDFRSIGHKVIYLANAYRTLQTIGWQSAEPVLRSLAYAMLNHEGEPNPAKADLEADRDGRRNRELVASLPAGWQAGRIDAGATTELLHALRTASSADATALCVEQLKQGVGAPSIYDALFAASAELTMRQPAIVPLHAMTTTNAIHYCVNTCTNDATRRFLLLQNVAFLARFREAAIARGALAKAWIDELEPADDQAADDALPRVFATLGKNSPAAARQLLAYLQAGHSADAALRYARQLIFLKGDDAHDYKYSSAVLEDYQHVSAEWRDRYLAAALFKMRNDNEPTTPLVHRIRDALAAS
jgi:hypothetical protein